jgi:hypothetical protein
LKQPPSSADFLFSHLPGDVALTTQNFSTGLWLKGQTRQQNLCNVSFQSRLQVVPPVGFIATLKPPIG